MEFKAHFSICMSHRRLTGFVNMSMHWDYRHRNGGINGKDDMGRFTKNGEPKNGQPCWSCEDRFEDSVQEPRWEKGMSAINEVERDALFAILRSMLVFRPKNRPTAKQVLGSEWMVKWTLPEFDKCRRAQEKNV